MSKTIQVVIPFETGYNSNSEILEDVFQNTLDAYNLPTILLEQVDELAEDLICSFQNIEEVIGEFKRHEYLSWFREEILNDTPYVGFPYVEEDSFCFEGVDYEGDVIVEMPLNLVKDIFRFILNKGDEMCLKRLDEYFTKHTGVDSWVDLGDFKKWESYQYYSIFLLLLSSDNRDKISELREEIREYVSNCQMADDKDVSEKRNRLYFLADYDGNNDPVIDFFKNDHLYYLENLDIDKEIPLPFPDKQKLIIKDINFLYETYDHHLNKITSNAGGMKRILFFVIKTNYTSGEKYGEAWFSSLGAGTLISVNKNDLPGETIGMNLFDLIQGDFTGKYWKGIWEND